MVRCEQWCLLTRLLATSPFIFVCCNSAVVMKIGPPWEVADVMVKLVGCQPRLWVVLLQVSWAQNMSNIPSKNALILQKKNHHLLHLAQPKYPCILLKYPSKNGVFEVTMVRKLVKKNRHDGNNNFLQNKSKLILKQTSILRLRGLRSKFLDPTSYLDVKKCTHEAPSYKLHANKVFLSI